MADRPVDFVSELNKIADELIEAYQQAWAGEGYKQQTFSHMVTYNGQTFQLQIKVPPYWKFVEYGTNPHDIVFKTKRPITRNGKQVGELMGPPISVLKDWLTIKKGVPASESLKRAIMIDRKIAQNNGRKISHPGFKGIGLFDRTISQGGYVEALCNEITRIMNVEISNDMIKMFDGLDSFETK